MEEDCFGIDEDGELSEFTESSERKDILVPEGVIRIRRKGFGGCDNRGITQPEGVIDIVKGIIKKQYSQRMMVMEQ